MTDPDDLPTLDPQPASSGGPRFALAAEGALIGVTLVAGAAVIAGMAALALHVAARGHPDSLADVLVSPPRVVLAVATGLAFAGYLGHALDGRRSGVLRGWAVVALSALAGGGAAAWPHETAAAGQLAPLLAAASAAAFAGAGLVRRRGAPPAGW